MHRERERISTDIWQLITSFYWCAPCRGRILRLGVISVWKFPDEDEMKVMNKEQVNKSKHEAFAGGCPRELQLKNKYVVKER